MKKYVVRRLLLLIPILFGITFLSFAMMRIAGSDVVLQRAEASGVTLTPEVIAAQRTELGLDQPFLVQYFRWLGGFLTGDLGTSYVSGNDVFETFLSKLTFVRPGQLAIQDICPYPHENVYLCFLMGPDALFQIYIYGKYADILSDHAEWEVFSPYLLLVDEDFIHYTYINEDGEIMESKVLSNKLE